MNPLKSAKKLYRTGISARCVVVYVSRTGISAKYTLTSPLLGYLHFWSMYPLSKIHPEPAKSVNYIPEKWFTELKFPPSGMGHIQRTYNPPVSPACPLQPTVD